MASGSITSWQIEGGKVETLTDLIFLGSKITVDGYCSHEIKRHLLLGKKAMTNIDSILKSRDTTLPTKVHAVKAIVFPVVMHRCEMWTIKKAEHLRTDAFKLWCWRVRFELGFESSLDSKEIKPVNPKENKPSIFTGRTEAEADGHLMQRADLLEKTLMLGTIEGRRRRGGQRMRCLDGITDLMDMI